MHFQDTKLRSEHFHSQKGWGGRLARTELTEARPPTCSSMFVCQGSWRHRLGSLDLATSPIFQTVLPVAPVASLLRHSTLSAACLMNVPFFWHLQYSGVSIVTLRHFQESYIEYCVGPGETLDGFDFLLCRWIL